VKGVVLVGGATRMPQIRRAVRSFFGQPPLTNLNPDEVVALGAADPGEQARGNRERNDDWLLLDVIPLSLGSRRWAGSPRRSFRATRPFRVARAGVHDVQGRPDRDGDPRRAGRARAVADCRSLARFELRGIPPMVAGAARIA
jgi:molecular chaperone HscA